MSSLLGTTLYRARTLSGFTADSRVTADKVCIGQHHIQGVLAHSYLGMVFSINCPATGDHSFDNFKKAALAFGAAQSSQAAAQSSWAATATSDVYGGQTYAPVYHPSVTDTVTLGSSVWTTAYESYPNSPAPTPVSAQGTEHHVIVGNNGTLTFDPPSIAAAPRDTVVSGPRSKKKSWH
jgi:hypothetical protein